VSNYLVILAGSPRGGIKTWKSLFKYVVDYLEADLAVLTTDNFIGKNLLFEKAKYIWSVKNFEDFSEYYRGEFSGNWENYFLSGKNTGLYESGMIHFAFKDIVLKKYIEIIKKYDFIIYSRFDQMYIDYHPKLSKNQIQILIPEGEDYFGLCDRHVAFNSELAEDIFNICGYIDSDQSLGNKSKYLNCEVTLLNQFKIFDLNKYVLRTKRLQFTTAIKNDKTNWRVPKYKIFLTNDLLIKYPDEFLNSLKNLIRKNGIPRAFIKHPILFLYFSYLVAREYLGKYIKNTSL